MLENSDEILGIFSRNLKELLRKNDKIFELTLSLKNEIIENFEITVFENG